MDVLSVVKNLHSLAINPRNRSSIVKDQGCLPGLVLFLDNEDAQVIILTLKTLHLLALHGPNRASMKTEIGMLPSLKLLMTNSNLEINKGGNDVYNLLTASKQTSRVNHGGNSNYFLGHSNGRRAKVITLQVQGLHPATRRICEEQLLQIKGVISFTFNMSKSRCIARVKPNIIAEKLCEKISDTKIMSAQQIVKNESGEEVVVSFGKSPVATSMSDEKQEVPDYLPEDEQNTQQTEKAVVRSEQAKGQQGGGWLSGVSNFISSTLYW